MRNIIIGSVQLKRGLEGSARMTLWGGSVIANADEEIKDGRIIELTLEAIKKCEE